MKPLLILILTLLSCKAFSCDCYERNLDEFISIADYVFIGKAVQNISPDAALTDSLDKKRFGSTVEFKVTQIIKGSISDEKIVIDQRGNGNCMRTFRFGDHYLVFGFNRRVSPSTPEQRNFDYLLDEILSGASDQDLEIKVEQYEKFFNDLSRKRTVVYTNGCDTFERTSKQFKKMKKYIR